MELQPMEGPIYRLLRLKKIEGGDRKGMSVLRQALFSGDLRQGCSRLHNCAGCKAVRLLEMVEKMVKQEKIGLLTTLCRWQTVPIEAVADFDENCPNKKKGN
ncbi:hypothetical protein M8C21_014373 [Ambrosia artemisiifolia]|uniref:Uncharacterized protein n=1 Tax=Ambrosia artemisiifolia TaxID=4212 RepID=A0AAD5GPC0_AMBAR|nr:hypothetical protein M8C21_014373 [Ambrosia artemisiifolia]